MIIGDNLEVLLHVVRFVHFFGHCVMPASVVQEFCLLCRTSVFSSFQNLAPCHVR